MDAATPTLVYDTETGIVDVGMSRFSLQALQRNGKVLISGSKMQGQTGTNEFSYFSRPATSVVPAHFDWTRIRKVGSSMDYSLFAYPGA
jgi:alpha-tubulin suppressor-like RCC1 family protein